MLKRSNVDLKKVYVIYKIYKIYKTCKIYKIYKTLIMDNCYFEKKNVVSKVLSIFFGKVFLYLLVCFVLQFIIFKVCIVFVVFFCIYEDMLKIFFGIFGKCPRSVNIFRTNSVVVIVCDWFLFLGA